LQCVTKTISRRLYTVKKTGFTPEAMAKAHAEGELLYKSRKTQAAAAKQILTRERTREERLRKKLLTPLTPKQIDRKVSDLEKRLPGITRVAPGPLSTRPREYYRMGEDMRGRMPDLLRRKLAGEWLVNGDWHQLADVARAAKHPDLARILQS
jgi:hypothetical protein